MLDLTVSRAVEAALSVAASHGLAATEAVVLHRSNKLALRLLPCDVMARVAERAEMNAELEVELARQLTDVGAPVASLDRRVQPTAHHLDGVAITFWRYYPTTSEPSTDEYAKALQRLHAGMRRVDVPTQGARDRVDSALALVMDRDRSPELGDADRDLLVETLRRFGPVLERGDQQLLHGEPHPGNLLGTAQGPLFIDLETCCRGPVEFDLAHAPEDVALHYPGVDPTLLRQCRVLMLAMIIAWRWDRDDRFPDGRRFAHEWTVQLREMLRSDDTP